ncbi:hypothetical protein ACL03H_01280 [Saccharopolyspora sp. MS10]|uniref:hypothetical protein n=1 Tax=Saccharopolyspora sp. MS10 TaxID=3385973 RepID=UPI0039A1D113
MVDLLRRAVAIGQAAAWLDRREPIPASGSVAQLRAMSAAPLRPGTCRGPGHARSPRRPRSTDPLTGEIAVNHTAHITACAGEIRAEGLVSRDAVLDDTGLRHPRLDLELSPESALAAAWITPALTGPAPIAPREPARLTAGSRDLDEELARHTPVGPIPAGREETQA